MKNFIFLLLSVVFFSCSSDEEGQSVSFSQTELIVDSGPGRYEVNIESNCKWEIPEIDFRWAYCHRQGDYPNESLEIIVNANNTYSERTAVITVVSEDGSCVSEMKIIQKENKGVKGDDVTGEFSGEMQEIVIAVKTNIEDLSVKHPDWVVPVKGGRSLSDKSYRFTLARNDSGSERIGYVVFSGEGQSWTYTVKQKSLSVLPTKILFEEGESIMLQNNSDFILTPVFYPENCTEKDLQWFSSDENVVSVYDGVLRIVGNGEAVVSARSTVADVSASISVSVKIKAADIIPADNFGNSMYSVNLGFDQRTKINLKTTPANAYIGDIIFSSSNPDVVSVEDGFLVASSSNEGTSVIDIKDSYSGLSTFVNVTVKRCITYAGFKNISQNVDGLMMSFGGGVQSGNVEVLSAVLVDENNRVLTMANQLSAPSDWVRFSTDHINMTSIFGITVIDENRLPKLRFLVSYRCNGEFQIYQEYIDVNMLTQVN